VCNATTSGVLHTCIKLQWTGSTSCSDPCTNTYCITSLLYNHKNVDLLNVNLFNVNDSLKNVDRELLSSFFLL
jgi:hypothetical protein